MARTATTLAIYLNRSLVGTLVQTVAGGVTFAYDDGWLDRSDRMPISLSLPLTAKPQKGAAVLAYFDNLLPDNEEIRRRIAARESAQSSRPFDLLAAIGRDCVGALRFLPPGTAPDHSPAMEATEISPAEVARRLRLLKSAPLGREVEDGEDFRISLAGAQDKTAFLRLPSGSWAIPKGLTPTSHILKPPIGPTPGHVDLSDSVENEWLSLAYCRALGLTVAGSTIEHFEDTRALVVERFDRTLRDGRVYRLPQEDLCQALRVPSSNKYLELARAIGITVPQNHLIDIAEIRGLLEDVASMGGKALAVERFDRARDGRRIHMEDFAQVFGLFPDDKYDQRSYANIAAVLWAETGETGTREFVRRLVFSVLIGNADMHLKNWSPLYPDGRTATVSPAYDFVATLPYIPGDRLALNFGGSRSLSEITMDQIRHFTDTAGLPTGPVSQLVTETAARTVECWKTLPQKDVLPDQIRKAIDRQIQTVAANVVSRQR